VKIKDKGLKGKRAKGRRLKDTVLYCKYVEPKEEEKEG